MRTFPHSKNPEGQRTTIKNLKRKLNSSKGSAILIAFLALLVVAVVSTLVITAASASAGRIANRTKRQQLMLAANSAAELLANEYSHMTPVVYTKQSDGSWKAPELSVPYGNFLSKSVGEILIGPGEKSGTFPITFTDPPETMEGITLSANLKMKGSAVNIGDYDTFREAFYTVLTLKADNGKDSYSISLILTPSVQERPGVDNRPSFSLQWYVGEITKGTFTSQKDA